MHSNIGCVQITTEKIGSTWEIGKIDQLSQTKPQHCPEWKRQNTIALSILFEGWNV